MSAPGLHSLVVLSSLLSLSPLPQAAAQPLTTVAERSGFVRTGRYDEVVMLCQAFAKRYPDKVRCANFGTTPEGRPMLALIASADGTLDPVSARQRDRPVVLFQGGIHAGEIDGKDAGFLLLRKLLAGEVLSGVLAKITAVFVPVFNVDGHERFGPHNRPNQNGPAEMGWRVTAQNLNLNRDYVKAEAPEMAAMLRLLREWDPLLYLDLHVTDGANFQHDVAVQIEPQHGGPAALRPLGAAMREGLFQRLVAQGHLPLPFYPSFVKDDDPTSGFSAGVAPPRFSHSYWSLRNRFAALVELHSWKDYRKRVQTTVDVLAGFLEGCAKNGPTWLAAVHAADAEDQHLGGTMVPLSYEATDKVTRLPFRGYAYTIEPSPISGAPRIRYDPRHPLIWDVPLRPEVKVALTAKAPHGGYLIPAAHAAWMKEKLQLHDLAYVVLPQQGPAVASTGAEVEVFRVTERRFRGEPYEGRLMVQVKGAWSKEVRPLPPGSLFVPIAQRGARLLVHLLDPAGPDSLLSWGFFNTALEQREYMESYVAEQVAEQMLSRDAKLRQDFLGKLAADPDFAKTPAARLQFFYRRHPSWDERYDMYPVYRLAQAPALHP